MVDLKKKILMKISRMDFKHVHFSDEYKDTEKAYKKLRDNMDKVAQGINNLMTYEHGGTAMKKLYHGLSVVSSASKMNYFKNHDIYEAFAGVNLELTDIEFDDGNGNINTIKDMGKKMSESYFDISKSKIRFNESCNKEMDLLVKMKKKSEVIDKERDNAKVYRYDLEKIKQGTFEENREEHDRYEDLFKNSVNKSLDQMREFIGNDGLQGVLSRILEYNMKFHTEALEALQRSK